MEEPETFIAGETEERKLVPTDELQPPETIGETESWITVKEGDHDDFYVKFLRHFYMPFLVGYSGRILVGWIVIFIICVIFGPAFLTSTRSNLDLPKGTPSAEAVDAFVTNYPSTSSWPRAFVVAHNEIPGRGVLTDATKKIYAALNTYKAKYPNTIGNIGGYYNYKAIGLISLANREVSGDNQTIICSVDFQKTATLGDIYTVADDLLDWTKSVSTPAESFYTTGIFPLFNDMQKQTAIDFALIDEIVLPICIVILGIALNSYRHMGVALVNLICTILLAFGILMPITTVVDVNPFAPSILLSLGIAVCFDYSLFMLTRFKEERLANKRSKQDAVFNMLCNSGHVVLLSGFTLFVTFILLLIFPQNFLQSVGYTCAVVVLSAMIVNMSITPAMLLFFECLSYFDPYPYMKPALNFCCLVPQGSPLEVTKQREEDFSARAQVPDNYVTRAIYMVCGRPRGEEETLEMMVRNSNAQKKVGDVADTGVQAIAEAPAADANAEKSYFAWVPGYATNRTIWFNVAFLSTKHAYILTLITIGITIPFLYTFLTFSPTSDAYLVYLQGSRSLEGLKTMTSSFPEGRLDPYMVVITTGKENAVLTPEYFQAENTLVHWILDNEGKYLDPSGITSLSYFGGNDVPLAIAKQYFDSTSALGMTPTALEYRTFVGGLMSASKAASLIKCELKVAPNAQIAVPFIRTMRSQLAAYSSTSPVATLPLKMHLFGGYTTTLDVQDSLYILVPIMIAVTCVIVLFMVGTSFGSVLLAVRLALTVFLSLCWTYGLMVLVYQPGDGQEAFARLTPSIENSSGIYWIIPIMSFSILVGLALDYDIFLMARVVEYRRLGWSDRAAVCLAIEKTASIITSAGTIMSISFAGLLIPKTVVLNQYGFSLFIGVALDTFLIRTIVVPVVMTVISGDDWKQSQANWWPGKMPRLAYASAKEEDEALRRGLWVPDVSHTCAADEIESGLEKLQSSEGEEGKTGEAVVVAAS